MSGETEAYNLGARFFHWGIAFLILGLLVVGFFMVGLEPPFKFQVYGWHKALGMAVLALGILRIVWRVSTSYPDHLSHYKIWEKWLSKTVHAVLYLLIIGMPLSGWVMSSAGGYPVSFFGLFEFPAIVEKNKELGGLARQAHEYIAFGLIALVGLHILGALKHHVMDKDTTLKRMGGHIVLAVLGILLLAAALFVPTQNILKSFSGSEEVVSESS